MPFSEEQISSLWQDCHEIPGKAQALIEKFIAFPYRDTQAREYGTTGFCRRIKTAARCIANVYAVIPPERTDKPSHEECTDAATAIQAFLFNIFGSVDNLAHILMYEKGLLDTEGKKFERKNIGLGPTNWAFRKAISPELRAYLKSCNRWFKYLSDFRHALAHRIPIYIPPYLVKPADAAEHNRLEEAKYEALRRGAFTEAGEFDEAQDALGQFEPVMTHSPIEALGMVAFHQQMLCDFVTIEEMAGMVLKELDR